MPETAAAYTNGYTNGHNHNYKYEMENGQTFLFTSESVGEGHPGECQGYKFTKHDIFNPPNTPDMFVFGCDKCI